MFKLKKKKGENMNKSKGLALLTVAVLTTSTVLGAPSNRKPSEDLKQLLISQGWQINNIKEEKGFYEVYGKDEMGNKVEVYFDPITLEKASKQPSESKLKVWGEKILTVFNADDETGDDNDGPNGDGDSETNDDNTDDGESNDD